MNKDISTTRLFVDINKLIEGARLHVSQEFNLTHVILNWHIGMRINNEILKNDRAEYGQNIVRDLAEQLRVKYGHGYDKTSLSRMVKFSKLYPNEKIVATLSQQLAWSHIIQLIAIKDDLKREFYTEMCRLENWDVRTLRVKVNGMLYERSALAKKPAELIKQEISQIKWTP